MEAKKGAKPIERPGRSEIEAAAARIRDVLVPTPLVPLHAHGPREIEGDLRILLKPEILQPAGSFKIRGIYHAVLRLGDDARRRGLSTVSAGNTAKALAWCGRRFGVPVRSLMPDTAATTKIEAVRALGGTPVLVPVAEVFRFLREHGWEDEPYAFIHPWTNRDVILGHGSLGLDILADCPEVETVYVPVGGGGLFAGVASGLKCAKPSVRVVAVEPERGGEVPHCESIRRRRTRWIVRVHLSVKSAAPQGVLQHNSIAIRVFKRLAFLVPIRVERLYGSMAVTFHLIHLSFPIGSVR
jgi:threonine dehydratase